MDQENTFKSFHIFLLDLVFLGLYDVFMGVRVKLTVITKKESFSRTHYGHYWKEICLYVLMGELFLLTVGQLELFISTWLCTFMSQAVLDLQDNTLRFDLFAVWVV